MKSPEWQPENTSNLTQEEKREARRIRKAEKRTKREHILDESFKSLLRKIEESRFTLSESQKDNLKEKLRVYQLKQNKKDLDINTLRDAILESPYLIDNAQIGIQGILDHHQQQSLLKIAERRKQKAEQTGNEDLNPHEALFQTEDGKYYMARLLNMPHLEEESDYMKHCVGTSDSYISRIKRGEIEILSFRTTPQIDKDGTLVQKDEPLVTIEYDVKRGVIIQVRKKDNVLLNINDPYFKDFLESLRKLKETEHDNGQKRNFKSINSSELGDVKVTEKNHLLTEKGTISYEDYDLDSGDFILANGPIDTRGMTNDDKSKICEMLLGKKVPGEQVTSVKEEITEDTRYYLGDLDGTVGDYAILNNRKNPLYIHGDADLYGCTSLTTIPENTTFNGNANFHDCTSLTTIPENITFNGDADLYGCTSLTTIPENTTFNGNANFHDCTSLTTIPENITFNGVANFEGCTSLTTIPENITFNGGANFLGCTSLTTIPENTTFNGFAYFDGCTSLTTIPENITFNGYANFRNCTSLTTIPENTTFNGGAIFYGCTSLTTISENVTFNGVANFRNCTSLTTIPENTTFNGVANFEGCTSLTTIPKNTTFNGDSNFRECTSLTTIPENITFNGGANFLGCTSLTTIPENTTFNGVANFLGCTSLTQQERDKLLRMKEEGRIKGVLHM